MVYQLLLIYRMQAGRHGRSSPDYRWSLYCLIGPLVGDLGREIVRFVYIDAIPCVSPSVLVTTSVAMLYVLCDENVSVNAPGIHRMSPSQPRL